MSQSEIPLVAYEVEGPVAIVRLDRPEKLNAFTPQMLREIRAAVERAADDERVVGIVLTGAGRGFCAGLDTSTLSRIANTGSMVEPAAPSEEPPALFSYFLRIPKPMIAAINGVAAGAGVVLGLSCDLRFASEQASFTTAFSQRGLVAEQGISWFLPRLVGTSRALDLLWSARRVDVQEAYRIGMVDRVVAPERLVDEAKAYIADLAARVSPNSMAVMKEQIYRDVALPFDVACVEMDKQVRAELGHPDTKEGIASFLERRPPRFAPYKRR